MGMFSTTNVWNRASSRTATMSKNLFVLSLSGFTVLGILFAALVSRISVGWKLNEWQFIGFAIGVVVVSLVGVKIFNKSDNPAFSLLGYALVAGPFGLLLGPFVAMFTDASVLKIFVLTILMVVVLGAIGTIIPESLERWGIWLLGGLCLLLVGYFVVPIFGFFGVNIGGALTLLDWAGVLIFGGLVIFDMNRAMRLPYTLDNSIDAAAAVFMDILNIFIRLLSLLGVLKSD